MRKTYKYSKVNQDLITANSFECLFNSGATGDDVTTVCSLATESGCEWDLQRVAFAGKNDETTACRLKRCLSKQL